MTKSANLICVGCKKSIGLLGRLTYDKRTRLCGSCSATSERRAIQTVTSDENNLSAAERIAEFMRETGERTQQASNFHTSASTSTVQQGRYLLGRELGRGGMGAVYQAYDQHAQRYVAVKKTLAETDELKRAFKREADLLANLSHPVLPKVTDYFSEHEGLYLVMDFVSGTDLKSLLELRK